LRTLGFGLGADYEQVAAQHAPPEERLTLSRLYRALDRVRVEERLAWTLRHIEEEQLDVVAQRCGCSLATAKRRVANAHHSLKRELGYG
jgi:DNA-directed RNA polymerase specialized sigma24 family protein